MFDVMLPTFRAAPSALLSICDIWAQKQKLLAEVLDCEMELRSKGGREQRVQCPNVELNDALLLGDPLSQCLRHVEERRSLGLVFCWFGWLFFFARLERFVVGKGCTTTGAVFSMHARFCCPAEAWDVRARFNAPSGDG